MDKKTPQLEDGYSRIANQILDDLCKIKLSSYQTRVLLYILRKTYGFNKKEDWISVSQIEEATGIYKAHVSRTKKELLERKIVTSNGNKIAFQKDSTLWRELPIQVTIKKVTNPGQKVTILGEKLPVQVDTKDNIQKTITKDSKNSKTACTKEEIKEICLLLDVSFDDASRVHQIIMNKIESGEFKNKTVYHSLKNWILMDIGRGNIKRKKGLLSNYQLQNRLI